MIVLINLNLRILCLFALALTCLASDDPVAARLARKAHQLESSGQTVRAYLLFAEAAARAPQNPTYRANRDALAPAAKLLTEAKVESADITSDVHSAEQEAAHPEPPIERITLEELQAAHPLSSIPQVQADTNAHDFDLRADAKSLTEQVSAAYGIRGLADADVKIGAPIHFELQGADFHSALEAVTAATHTFVFPVSPKLIYFAPDTEEKRNQLEPIIILTFPLQEALTERDLIDAANAVRGLLKLRTIGWDSFNRRVVIRDRVTRAHVARAMMESLLLPPAQFSLEVQFLTADTDRSTQYGFTLQNVFQFIDFGKIGLQNVLPAAVSSTKFLTFGGGATLFGVGVADAMAFATYSNSSSRAIYDATVSVSDRQSVNFHIGDKYPIPTSLYTGFSTPGGSSIYNPAPQITLEDLGLILKITPHVSGDGDIVLAVEADYKTLGTETINSVPSIAERAFKGTVSLREGQWAILAGMDASSTSTTRSGTAGLGQIPGLSQILNQTKHDTQTSNTLLVIKPTLTRLPVTGSISPQFLIGPIRGERVVI